MKICWYRRNISMLLPPKTGTQLVSMSLCETGRGSDHRLIQLKRNGTLFEHSKSLQSNQTIESIRNNAKCTTHCISSIHVRIQDMDSHQNSKK